MPSSKEIWSAMQRLHVLPSGEAERVKGRWFKPDRTNAEDGLAFAKWLISNGVMTKFALEKVATGHGDSLQFGNYLLQDDFKSGPHEGSFLATDKLGRKVLIDLLPENLSKDPEVVRAFEAAAERLMGIRSPNVNQVLDFGKANGRSYLVRQYDEGTTLAEVLHRKKQLPAEQAARIFALAFAGVQAMHDKQVQGGDLRPENIFLAEMGKGRKGRTIKILRPGFPASLFQDGGTKKADEVISALRPLSRPEDDLFHLGQTFFEAVSGKPCKASLAGGGSHKVETDLPIDTPEILSETISSLLSSNVSERPKVAGRVAKTLRIYLASEEENRASNAEDEIHSPLEQTAPVEAEVEEEEEEEAEEKPTRVRPAKTEAEPSNRFLELWEEFKPQQRELFFMAGGAAGIILIILLVRILTGIHFINIVCILTGFALSYLVDRFIRQRQEQQAES